MLVVACVLSIIVLGIAEAGPIPGLTFGGQDFIFNIFHWKSTTETTAKITGTQTTVETSGVVTTSHQTATTIRFTATNQTGVLPGSESSGPFVLFVLVPLVLLLGAGVLFIVLREKGGLGSVDLTDEFKQMEAQRSYLASLSSRLRNLALLRYYVLLQKVCLKARIVDGLAETPQEFVRRASAELDVDEADALKFAHTIDMARYGPELSEGEIQQASRVMDLFTGMVKRRVEGA